MGWPPHHSSGGWQEGHATGEGSTSKNARHTLDAGCTDRPRFRCVHAARTPSPRVARGPCRRGAWGRSNASMAGTPHPRHGCQETNKRRRGLRVGPDAPPPCWIVENTPHFGLLLMSLRPLVSCSTWGVHERAGRSNARRPHQRQEHASSGMPQPAPHAWPCAKPSQPGVVTPQPGLPAPLPGTLGRRCRPGRSGAPCAPPSSSPGFPYGHWT